MKDQEKQLQGTIEVSGAGRVEVAPDEADVHLSVITEAATATEAVAANATTTQAVIDAVSAVPNHGVTTVGLSVSPVTRYDQATGTSTIVGFRATNGVRVKTKVGYAGQVFDAGFRAGANRSSGIDFRVQNEAPHREKALRLAIDDAFAQARIVASAAAVELVGPETISVDSGGNRFFLRAMALEAGAPPTPVQPGDLTIAAGVRIVFRTRV